MSGGGREPQPRIWNSFILYLAPAVRARRRRNGGRAPHLFARRTRRAVDETAYPYRMCETRQETKFESAVVEAEPRFGLRIFERRELGTRGVDI